MKVGQLASEAPPENPGLSGAVFSWNLMPETPTR